MRWTGALLAPATLVLAVSVLPAALAAGGDLDTSFDTDGKVTTPIGPSTELAYSVAIQSDGKIVAAGYSNSGSSYDFALARYNTDGSLDTSFDSDGKVTTAIGSADEEAWSVAVQSDGKIVAAGFSWNGSDADFALARYNTDGSLDTSFDSDGKVTTPVGSATDRANAVAIQSDGKIVAAGWSYSGPNADFALARYNTNGSLDTSFDSDGTTTTPVDSSDDFAYSVAIQSDGKIVAAGSSSDGSDDDFALARYNPDGSLDTAFDTDGKVTTPIDSSTDLGYSVAIQSDGKIVAAGASYISSNWDFALARYNTDGSLDTSFDSDGKVTTPIGSSIDQAFSVAIQSDGKIVAAGFSNTGSNGDFALARYDTEGSLDTTFDTDGKVTTDFPSSSDWAYSVATQPDGRIVAAGYSWNGSDNDFALVRYGSPSVTSLSINAPTPVAAGTTVRITGTLSSTDPACVASRQVTLKKGSTTLGPKLTGATGGYRFRTKITAKTVVQVSFAGTPECAASKSVRKTIRVT